MLDNGFTHFEITMKKYSWSLLLLESSKVDQFHIGVLIQTHAGPLLPDARGLVAPEGCLRGGHAHIIDAHHPALQLPGHAPDLGVVPGVEEARQPPVAVVGRGHGLLLGVEGGDGGDRAEYLLPPAAHVTLEDNCLHWLQLDEKQGFFYVVTLGTHRGADI